MDVNIKGAQGRGNVIWLGVWSLSARARPNMSCHGEEQQTLACVAHDSSCADDGDETIRCTAELLPTPI